MRFGITSKMVIMASTLVLCMSGITGWVFYVKADRILTDRGLDYLTTDTCRIGHTLNSDIRQERSDTWRLTQKDSETKKCVAMDLLDKLREGRPRDEQVNELVKKIQKLFAEHTNYIEATYVYRTKEQDVEVFCAEREGARVRQDSGKVLVRQAATDFFGLPVPE